MEKIMKIGSVELTEAEAARLYADGKYILTYSKVYQIHYSVAQGCYYGTVIYSKPTRGGCGFTRRGRFFAMSAREINEAIGVELLRAG